ncbi:hypothetical protein AC578_1592 [Pseudocercospora eumusae]|uniref:Uncharacterized protein n=1 Tax=Pseudocercospora eumusae TaxID=321146 RepID=A0A139HM41_9PEZI|nr:hypothetical protein AC578_1592 [Pseudocercospora eumusae]
MSSTKATRGSSAPSSIGCSGSQSSNSDGDALTSANLAFHNEAMENNAVATPVARWLAERHDQIIQGRRAEGWDELVKVDELAADIEAAGKGSG